MNEQERKVMEMALEALEEINEISKQPMGIPLPAEIDGAMDALRQALAQGEQEPQRPVKSYTNGEPQYAMENPDDHALRNALSQPEQEPVAWMVLTQDDKKLMLYGEEKPPIFNTSVKLIPLYTAPPSKPWVSLTDDEVGILTVSFHGLHHIETPLLAKFIRAIEAKLKELNT
jgi:hypothetical protein